MEYERIKNKLYETLKTNSEIILSNGKYVLIANEVKPCFFTVIIEDVSMYFGCFSHLINPTTYSNEFDDFDKFVDVFYNIVEELKISW